MPIHLYLSAHSKQQLGRFVRIAAAFAVSSGLVDTALGSSWLRTAIGAGGAAALEVAYRQFVKTAPAKTSLMAGGPVPTGSIQVVAANGPEVVVAPPVTK